MPTPLAPALRQQFMAAPHHTLRWREVMQAALYHPEAGYYANTPRRIGRKGDFYTAVSVGPLYGRLLAEQIAHLWEQQGRPQPWLIAEQAAHDGQLMEDVLTALEARHPRLWQSTQVAIIEPQSRYRSAQQERLARLGHPHLHWLDSPLNLPNLPGLLLCNELLDAFPVERIQWLNGTWHEQGVRLTTDGTLVWTQIPITDPLLLSEIGRLPSATFPDGYATELHLSSLDWLRQVADSPFPGALWIADYGLDADDYYTPERADGTLRRYFQHQTDGDVLSDLGQADLTSHLCFSRLIDEATALGRPVLAYQSQGLLLTHLATPWLRSLEGQPPSGETAALLRQFQSLTHPGHMGKAFRILLLGPKPPAG